MERVCQMKKKHLFQINMKFLACRRLVNMLQYQYNKQYKGGYISCQIKRTKERA